MIGLVAAAARSAERLADMTQLRAHVIDRIKTAYAAGRGTYQGRFDNWSFRTATRAAARTPFILQLVHGQDATQLAPVQFVRLRDGSLRPVNTLYLDIDMIRAFRVNDNEKSFFAEFYLAMHDDGKGTSIDDIDFANAFLDPRTNDRQLNIRVLNQGGTSAAYPDHVKIYHVAGRFMFDPDFESYPFDVQRFSIDIRPKRDEAPFIVQPPPPLLRDRAVLTDNWEPKEQYVGYDEDFVPTTDAKSHEQSIVPFYKASFVWMMARQTTDYYLRVVVPLAFILLVAYLSIFIPRGALRGHRHHPDHGVALCRRALFGAAPGRRRNGDAVGPHLPLHLHGGEHHDRHLDHAREPVHRAPRLAAGHARHGPHFRDPRDGGADGALHLSGEPDRALDAAATGRGAQLIGRGYLQAWRRAVQVVVKVSSLQAILMPPFGRSPWSAIEFLSAAVAMNTARSLVIIVASPPARRQPASAGDIDRRTHQSNCEG